MGAPDQSDRSGVSLGEGTEDSHRWHHCVDLRAQPQPEIGRGFLMYVLVFVFVCVFFFKQLEEKKNLSYEIT